MPRARNPNREKAYQIWLDHGGTIANRQLAEMLGEKEKTISAWKARDKWNVVLQKDECSTTNENCSTTKDEPVKSRRGAPKRNKNAVGNQGGRAPVGNQNATKHGIFAKYIPADTLLLVDELNQEDKATRIKRQIALLEAQIIRAQMIMNVDDPYEVIKEIKRTSAGQGGSSEEFEIQFAWDRHGNFLNSMSRAMATLSNLYKTLAEFTDNQGDDVQSLMSGYVEALGSTAEGVWNDEETQE